jgi:hypothetical protein
MISRARFQRPIHVPDRRNNHPSSIDWREIAANEAQTSTGPQARFLQQQELDPHYANKTLGQDWGICMMMNRDRPQAQVL